MWPKDVHFDIFLWLFRQKSGGEIRTVTRFFLHCHPRLADLSHLSAGKRRWHFVSASPMRTDTEMAFKMLASCFWGGFFLLPRLDIMENWLFNCLYCVWSAQPHIKCETAQPSKSLLSCLFWKMGLWVSHFRFWANLHKKHPQSEFLHPWLSC